MTIAPAKLPRAADAEPYSPGRARLRRGRARAWNLNAVHRPAARRARRERRGHPLPRCEFARARGPRRRRAGHRPRHRSPVRRRPADQHLPDARGPGRSGRADRPGRGGRGVGRRLDGRARPRFGRAARVEHEGRRRRLHPGRRVRLARPAVRPGRPLGAPRAEVVTADGELITAESGRAPGPVLGTQGGHRQPRHRHGAGIRPASGRGRSTPATSTTRWTAPRDVLGFFAAVEPVGAAAN